MNTRRLRFNSAILLMSEGCFEQTFDEPSATEDDFYTARRVTERASHGGARERVCEKQTSLKVKKNYMAWDKQQNVR